MASRGPLTLANCLDDLEAVQFRHVDVQEQQVAGPFFSQQERLPTVIGQPHGVAEPREQLLGKLRVEFIVLSH